MPRAKVQIHSIFCLINFSQSEMTLTHIASMPGVHSAIAERLEKGDLVSYKDEKHL